MANSLTIILYGGNIDELRCGQDKLLNIIQINIWNLW